MHPVRILAGAAAVAALGLCVAGAAPAPKTVTIDNFTFSPPTLAVAAGTKVTWTNDDDIPHTVRAADGSFHSAAMDTADSYSVTFAKPGSYAYFCSLHPKMVGRVIVK